MHDYYRIAEVSGASRRTPARQTPAWAVLAHALPQPAPHASSPGLHLVRALEPERPAIGRALGDPDARVGSVDGSVGAAVAAFDRGASIFRVHEVRPHVEALALAAAVERGGVA